MLVQWLENVVASQFVSSANAKNGIQAFRLRGNIFLCFLNHFLVRKRKGSDRNKEVWSVSGRDYRYLWQFEQTVIVLWCSSSIFLNYGIWNLCLMPGGECLFYLDRQEVILLLRWGKEGNNTTDRNGILKSKYCFNLYSGQ